MALFCAAIIIIIIIIIIEIVIVLAALFDMKILIKVFKNL